MLISYVQQNNPKGKKIVRFVLRSKTQNPVAQMAPLQEISYYYSVVKHFARTLWFFVVVIVGVFVIVVIAVLLCSPGLPGTCHVEQSENYYPSNKLELSTIFFFASLQHFSNGRSPGYSHECL